MRDVETIDAAKQGTMMVCVVTVGVVALGKVPVSASDVGGTPVKAVMKEENIPALFLWVGLGGAVLVSWFVVPTFVLLVLEVVAVVVSVVGTVTCCRCQLGAYLNSQIQHIPP